MRLTFAGSLRRWPVFLPPIAWSTLLALLPWWIGVPLLLALVAMQVAQVPRLRRYSGMVRRALRWGAVGVLVAGYRAFGGHTLGLTFTALAALVAFSLLVLLESWQDRKPLRNALLADASPDWNELARAPIGPAAAIVHVHAASWMAWNEHAISDVVHVEPTAEHAFRVDGTVAIHRVEPNVSLSGDKRWMAWRITAGRGVVLYDRAHGTAYRLRGWQLFGWHGDEAWLMRSDDQPPLALSHVLGQDQL